MKPDENPRCKTCNNAKPKTDNGAWLVALPDELEGTPLLDGAGVWCSIECMHADPAYKTFADGAEMFDAYNRFGNAHGGDLIGAYAKSRGLSANEARRFLEGAFDKGLKQLRKQKEFKFE